MRAAHWAMRASALLLAALACARASAAACPDDDAGIIGLTQQFGLAVAGCSDFAVQALCDHPTFGAFVAPLCCATCSGQQSATPQSQPAPAPAAPCLDDDAGIIGLSQQYGLGAVAGCSDAQVQPLCDDPTLGAFIAPLCCATCSGQQTATPQSQPAPTPAPAAAPCLDDDAGIVGLTQQYGPMVGAGVVAGCSDAQVPPLCSDPMVGVLVAAYCCATCSSGQQTAAPQPQPAPAPAPTAAPCLDDDAGVIALAGMGGYAVTGCSDPQVKAMCRDAGQRPLVAERCCATCRTPIWLVGFFALTNTIERLNSAPGSPRYHDAHGPSLREGVEIMLEQINAHPNLLPGHELKVAWQDDRCLSHRSSHLFFRNLHFEEYEVFGQGVPLDRLDADEDGGVTPDDANILTEIWDSDHLHPGPVGILGPTCSDSAAGGLVGMAETSRLPVISMAGQLGDTKTYPNLWRVLPSDQVIAVGGFMMAKAIGVTSRLLVVADRALQEIVWYASEFLMVADIYGIKFHGDSLESVFIREGLSPDEHEDLRALVAVTPLDESGAADLVKRMKKQAVRSVYLVSFHQEEIRQLMCASHRLEFVNVVWSMDALNGAATHGWWRGQDTSCDESEILSVAQGYLSLSYTYFRRDDTVLSCSADMTAHAFRDEWLRRQNITSVYEERSNAGLVDTLAAMAADAVCMYAQMLQNLIYSGQFTAENLSARSPEAYAAIQESFSTMQFQGVTGPVTFSSASPTPYFPTSSTVTISQLQGDSFVAIAEASAFNIDGSPRMEVLMGQPSFDWSNLTRLKFGLPNESFSSWRSSGQGKLAEFLKCSDGKVLNFSTNACEECPVGKVFDETEQDCICNLGFYTDINSYDNRGCLACDIGRYRDDFLSAGCVECKVGKFANETGFSECLQCPQGSFTDTTGSSECASCPIGSRGDSAGCAECEVGKFANETGFSECLQCPQGSFTDTIGSSECASCPDTFVTSAEGSDKFEDCRCPAGWTHHLGKCEECPKSFILTAELVCVCPESHRFDSQKQECVRCEKYLDCPGGHRYRDNDTDSTVGVQAGYMTLKDAPFSVFSCFLDTAKQQISCPGVRSISAGWSMCADGFNEETPRCGSCKRGFFRSTDFTCQPCDDNDASTWILGLKVVLTYLTQIAFAAYVYLRFNRPQTGTEGIVDGIVGFVQLLQTVAQMDLVVPEALAAAFAVLGQMTIQGFLHLLQLNTECYELLRSGSSTSIILQAFTPLMFFVNLAVMQVGYKLVGRSLNLDFVYNTVGLVFSGLFLSLVSMSLSLFYTVNMPNGKAMVKAFPEMEFGSEEWLQVLPVNLVSTMLYGVTTVAYVGYTVWTAPRRISTENNFAARYRFCFGTKRPDRWWWILVGLAYGFAMNLVQVVLPSKSVHSKFYTMLLFSFMQTMFVYSAWPYKIGGTNNVELVFKMAFVVIMMLGTSFIEKSTGDELDQMNTIWGIVIIGVIVPTMFYAVGMLLRTTITCLQPIDMSSVRTTRTLWKMRDVALAAVMISEDDFAKKVKALGDYDNRLIQRAMDNLVNVVFGEQSSEQWTNQRLIPGGKYMVWNHNRRVVDLLHRIQSGEAGAQLERSARLRLKILEIANAIYSRGATRANSWESAGSGSGRFGSVASRVELSTQRTSVANRADVISGTLQGMADDAATRTRSISGSVLLDSIANSPSLRRSARSRKSLTLENFREVSQVKLGVDLTDEDANTIFAMLDVTGSEKATVQSMTELFSALAPESLVRTLGGAPTSAAPVDRELSGEPEPGDGTCSGQASCQSNDARCGRSAASGESERGERRPLPPSPEHEDSAAQPVPASQQASPKAAKEAIVRAHVAQEAEAHQPCLLGKTGSAQDGAKDGGGRGGSAPAGWANLEGGPGGDREDRRKP